VTIAMGQEDYMDLALAFIRSMVGTNWPKRDWEYGQVLRKQVRQTFSLFTCKIKLLLRK
jgi:hypothetical protein